MSDHIDTQAREAILNHRAKRIMEALKTTASIYNLIGVGSDARAIRDKLSEVETILLHALDGPFEPTARMGVVTKPVLHPNLTAADVAKAHSELTALGRYVVGRDCGDEYSFASERQAHYSHGSALAEAHRLADKEGTTFAVFRWVESVIPPAPTAPSPARKHESLRSGARVCEAYGITQDDPAYVPIADAIDLRNRTIVSLETRLRGAERGATHEQH
jgi:hypothetical protein